MSLGAHQRSETYDREALVAIGYYFKRYQFLSQSAEFHALAPREGEPSDHWINMGAGLLEAFKTGNPHSGAPTYAALLQAYQESDVPVFNARLADYRRSLAGQQSRSAASANFEVLFNRVQPFYHGMIFYLLAGLLAFAGWLRWPDLFRQASFYLLLLALAVHTGGLLTRIVLQGRPPVTNLYSSAVFVGWVAVGLGVYLERKVRNGIGTIVAAGIGFATLIIAHHLMLSGDSMEMMRAVLDSNFWLGTHVVTVTIGYASTFLAGAIAIVYILRGVLSRSLTPETAQAMSRMTYGVVCFSLFFSFVGTVLGGIWADQSWGRFWGWDPKENGALLIVLWNAIILHARWGKLVGDRGVMVMAVFGSVITSLSWFGVNMLGIGLHSYGFMDRAFFWLAAFIVSQLAIMGLGSLPLRTWRSFNAVSAREA